MIIFLHHGLQTRTHESIHGQEQLCETHSCSYDWLLSARKLPQATYVFTDRERMDNWEVRVLADYYRHLKAAGSGYRVVNDPSRMLDRPALLRQLYREGINSFNAYRVTECLQPERFPVFIRREFDHAKPLTDLLYTTEELDEALRALRENGEPLGGLLVTEFAAEPVDDQGLYRKMSAFRIGDDCFFFNTVHERSWLVKYGEENIADQDLYEEERKMIRDNAYANQVALAFELSGIEYGRMDFGVIDGQIQVYEINTNPTVKPGMPHPNATREKNGQRGWELYCEALNKLDTTTPGASCASRFSHALLRRRRPPIWRRMGRINR